MIGVPKTIDNDLSGTDYTFGFWTAVQIASDAIDRLHTTAESHDRVIVVEVMGRHAGWIALESGVSGGAHAILIPEQPASIEAVCRRIEGGARAAAATRSWSSARASSWATRAATARWTSSGTPSSPRPAWASGSPTHLRGHRRGGARGRAGPRPAGGTPTAFDRALSTRFGIRAAELVEEKGFGRMVALRGARVTDVLLEEAVSELKTVPEDVWRQVESVVAGP